MKNIRKDSPRSITVISGVLVLLMVLVLAAGCDLLGDDDQSAGPGKEEPTEEKEAAPVEEVDTEATARAEQDAAATAQVVEQTRQAEADIRATEQAIAAAAATAEAEAAALSIVMVTDYYPGGRTSWASTDEIGAALTALGYEYDTWNTTDQGFPTLSYIKNYTVAIWAVGDNCCDQPQIDSANVIMAYVDGGGDVLIEGAAVAYAWVNSPFLENYLGVNHYGWNPVQDLVLAAPSHPVTQGMQGTIQLINISGVRPDTITLAGAQSLYVRGPKSGGRDMPSIVAYEPAGKTIFASVPLQWLPPGQLELFMQNTLNWFSQN